MSFLERIQSKPKAIKAQYAFISACIVTGLIGLVWVSTVPARFEELKPTVANQEAEEEVKTFGEVFSDTKNQLGNINNWNGDPETDIEIEQQILEDSALGALDSEIEYQVEADTPTAPEALRMPQFESTTEVISEEKVSLPAPSPRVILIATSTSQKSE